MWRVAWGGCFVLFSLASGGCLGPRSEDVSGTVTFDGVPLPQGQIRFSASDDSHTAVVGKIENGQYQLQLPHGAKRVEVYASKESGTDIGGGRKMPVQYLPSRYNAQSKLAAEVSSANRKFDFALKSDAPSADSARQAKP